MPTLDEHLWRTFKEIIVDKEKFKNPKRKQAATQRIRDDTTKQFVKRGLVTKACVKDKEKTQSERFDEYYLNKWEPSISQPDLAKKSKRKRKRKEESMTQNDDKENYQ